MIKVDWWLKLIDGWSQFEKALRTNVRTDIADSRVASRLKTNISNHLRPRCLDYVTNEWPRKENVFLIFISYVIVVGSEFSLRTCQWYEVRVHGCPSAAQWPGQNCSASNNGRRESGGACCQLQWQSQWHPVAPTHTGTTYGHGATGGASPLFCKDK